MTDSSTLSVDLPRATGRRCWAIAEGYLPGWSHGPEPELASHETLCVLNTGAAAADIALWLYFTDREPAGPYRFSVAARRTLHLRLGELSDPEPAPRETDFACLIQATHPIVVQHTRLDSRQAELGLLSTIAWSGD